MTECVFYKNQDEIPKEIIYCRGAKSPQEVFTTGFPSKVYVGHFYEKHKGSGEINDINLYIMKDSDNKQYIYQYCGNVTDCEDFIVPDTFYVKKVGMMIDLEDDVKIMYKISDSFKSLYNIEKDKLRVKFFCKEDSSKISGVILNKSFRLNDYCNCMELDLKYNNLSIYLEYKDGHEEEYPMSLDILDGVTISLDAKKDEDDKYTIYIDTEV